MTKAKGLLSTQVLAGSSLAYGDEAVEGTQPTGTQRNNEDTDGMDTEAETQEQSDSGLIIEGAAPLIDDELNQHECMVVVVATVNRLGGAAGASNSAPPPPKWMG